MAPIASNSTAFGALLMPMLDASLLQALASVANNSETVAYDNRSPFLRVGADHVWMWMTVCPQILERVSIATPRLTDEACVAARRHRLGSLRILLRGARRH